MEILVSQIQINLQMFVKIKFVTSHLVLGRNMSGHIMLFSMVIFDYPFLPILEKLSVVFSLFL